MGHGAYMDRIATEENEFHQEQQSKQQEWQQVSTKFKVLKCGFAANKPHPGDDVLWWLKWNDGNLRTYPKWATELQSYMSHQLQKTRQDECICHGSGPRQSISWEFSIFPALQHQTT